MLVATNLYTTLQSKQVFMHVMHGTQCKITTMKDTLELLEIVILLPQSLVQLFR